MRYPESLAYRRQARAMIVCTVACTASLTLFIVGLFPWI